MYIKYKNMFMFFIICTSFLLTYGHDWSDRDRQVTKNGSCFLSFLWGNPPIATGDDNTQETVKRKKHVVCGVAIRAVTHFTFEKIYAHFGWSNQAHDNAIRKRGVQKSSQDQSISNDESVQDVVDKMLINGKVFLQSDSGRYVLESTTNNIAVQLFFCKNGKYEIAKHAANIAVFTLGAEIGAGYLCDVLHVKRTSYTAMVIYGVIRFASCFGIRAVQTCMS